MYALPDKKYGIIGADGLIGSAFATEIKGKASLLTYGRSETSDIFLDLNLKCKSEMFEGVDILIHAAGIRDEDCKMPSEDFQRRAYDNVDNLFEQALSAGVSKIIYISTAHVYGPLQGCVTEETPVNPQSIYAEAHVYAEERLKYLTAKFNCQALSIRPNAVYGMTFDPARFERWGLVPFDLPRQAVEKKTITIRAPHVRRNFISTRAIARTALLVSSNLKSGECHKLNVVGLDMMKIGEYAEVCKAVAEEVMGESVELIMKPRDHQLHSFEYRSLYSSCNEMAELASFLHEYILWLHSETINKV